MDSVCNVSPVWRKFCAPVNVFFVRLMRRSAGSKNAAGKGEAGCNGGMTSSCGGSGPLIPGRAAISGTAWCNVLLNASMADGGASGTCCAASFFLYVRNAGGLWCDCAVPENVRGRPSGLVTGACHPVLSSGLVFGGEGEEGGAVPDGATVVKAGQPGAGGGAVVAMGRATLGRAVAGSGMCSGAMRHRSNNVARVSGWASRWRSRESAGVYHSARGETTGLFTTE